jgi:hypothetical protein
MYSIVHSPHSKPSRDYVQENEIHEQISRVYNWDNAHDRAEYMSFGYPVPSIFPALVESGNNRQIKNGGVTLSEDMYYLESGKLEIERPIRKQSIMNRTRIILGRGFNDELTGKILGASADDTANWAVLLQIKDTLSYPFSGVKDISGLPITFQSKEALMATFVAGTTWKMAVLGAESALLVQVTEATTYAALMAIVDNRQ